MSRGGGGEGKNEEAEEGKAKHSLGNFFLCSRLMEVIKEETQ